MIYRAVLSDVDDTLIDSKRTQVWGWQRWATGHGLDPQPFISAHGLRIEEKLARFAPHLSAEEESANLVMLVATCPFAADPLLGSQRLLDTTPEIGLVTSGPRVVVRSQLLRAGLEPPPVFVTAEDVRNGKPDPEPYLTAAHLLDVPPAECIVLEDAPAGVRAGVAAGMTVVAVTTTTPAQELFEAGARLVVADVAAFLLHRDAGTLPPPRG